MRESTHAGYLSVTLNNVVAQVAEEFVVNAYAKRVVKRRKLDKIKTAPPKFGFVLRKI